MNFTLMTVFGRDFTIHILISFNYKYYCNRHINLKNITPSTK